MTSHHPTPAPALDPASQRNTLCRLETVYRLLDALGAELTGLLREPNLDHDPPARRLLTGIAQRAGQDRDLTGGLLRTRGLWEVDHASHTTAEDPQPPASPDAPQPSASAPRRHATQR